MNIYFNYDNLSQKYDAPVATFNYYDVQRFVPYVTRQNKAWCMYHQQWEQVFVNYGENNSGPFSTLLLACGMPLNNRIGLNRNWNRNQFCLEIDENKMVLRVKEKYTYDEIHDKQDYHIKNVYGKYFDFANGRIFYPKLFNLKMIPDFAVEYLDNFFSSCCKQLYGKEIKRNNAPMYDFVKYPTCPSFSKLIKYIDNGSFYNFRQELNLFKEFCSWMNIKETKKLRKAFMKEPRTLLIYAMCQQLGFSDTNAIQIIAENQLFFNKYAENNNRLRFSMNRHEVYMDNTFFNNQIIIVAT